jgi:hypothetical protein
MFDGKKESAFQTLKIRLERSMPGVAGQASVVGRDSPLKTLLSHLLQVPTPQQRSLLRAIQVDRQLLLGPSSLCHALSSTIVAPSTVGKVQVRDPPTPRPVSCLPRISQPASLHRHPASFISLSDAVSAYCSFTLLSSFLPTTSLPASRSPLHSDSPGWACLRLPPSPC